MVIPMLRWLYFEEFIQRIDAFAGCLKKRLLPSFDTLMEDTHQLEREEIERLGRHATEETDPAHIAETAFNKALEFYQVMTEMAQGVRNLFAAGLYHMFEQQFLFFHRKELLHYDEETNLKLFRIAEAKKRLKALGIYIDKFRSWPKIKELRILANAVKHADGDSCEQLKRLRPDLFCYPDPPEVKNPFPLRPEVFEPLSGTAIYVSDEDFDTYVKAVKEFWSELVEAQSRG